MDGKELPFNQATKPAAKVSVAESAVQAAAPAGQAAGGPKRETDRRALMAVAEVLTVFNFRNERQFLIANGFNETLLYKIRKGIQSAGEDLISALTTKYRTNANFIFLGEGQILRPAAPEPSAPESKSGNVSASNMRPNYHGTPIAEVPFVLMPFIPVRATASFIESYLNNQGTEPAETFPVMEYLARRHPDGLVIEISGDSMAGQLRHGSKVFAIPVPQPDWQYQSSGVYAVMYRDYFVVKRVKDNQLMQHNLLELHSDNPRSGSMPVPAHEIRAMWKVINVVDAVVE